MCDGDKTLTNSTVAEARKWVTVERLQGGYIPCTWYENAKKVIVAMGDAFRESVEKMYEEFIGQSSGKWSMEIFSELWESVQSELNKRLESREELGRYRRFTHNNFRNIHYLPMILKRCRWRQRESRRTYAWLVPNLTIIDEYSILEPEPG